MPSKSLGVGNDNLLSRLSKDSAQSDHFGLGASSPCWSIGFVRYEDKLAGHRIPAYPMLLLRRGNQVLHHLGDMLCIQAATVERAIGCDCPQDLANRKQAPFKSCLRAFHHQRRRAHSQNHTMPPAIEGQGRFADHLVGCRGPTRQETSSNPAHQCIAGYVVRSHHHHTPASSRPNPVLGKSHGLRSARACRVDLRIRTPSANVFSKLRMTHRQDLKEVFPVEMVGIPFQLMLQRGDSPIHFLQELGRGMTLESSPQGLKVADPLSPVMITVKVLHIGGQSIIAGKCRAKDYACIVPQRIREHPSIRQLRALGGGFIVHAQRNPGIAQCL